MADKHPASATSGTSRPPRRAPRSSPQVLKHDETFALFDRFGDIQALGARRRGPVPRGHALPVAPGAADRGRAAALPRLDGEGGQQPAGRRADEPRPRPRRRRACRQGHAAHLPRQAAVAAAPATSTSASPTTARAPVSTHAGDRASTPTSSTCSRCAACSASGAASGCRSESTAPTVVLPYLGLRRRGAPHAAALRPGADAARRAHGRVRAAARCRTKSATCTAP